MAHKIESLRGMEDILPGEVEKWQWLEEKARCFFEGRGYREIRTPILEYTELFSRSVGESSDIVNKEMFSFKDRGERDVTLRPEMTASVARAVIEKGLLTQAKSLHLYYIAPMFRAERPQAGRKRQFHQIGIEIINESGQSADLSAIAGLCGFVERLGVKGLTLRINDLADAENQKKILKEFFSAQKDKLCKDCNYRLEKNPLRILDCKNPECGKIIEKAPQIEPSGNLKGLIMTLQEMTRVPAKIDPRLVRGLDYYNGIVFELAAEGLGAQDALAGGGRYDRLYEDLGGKPTPCTGFSIGMERLISLLEKSEPSFAERINEKFVYFAPLYAASDPKYREVKKELSDLVLRLRDRGIKAWLGPDDVKLVDHFKKAEKFGGKFVVIVGEKEWGQNYWKVKRLGEKEDMQVSKGGLVAKLFGGDEAI